MQTIQHNVIVMRDNGRPRMVVAVIKLIDNFTSLETITLPVSSSKRRHTLPECCGELPTNVINFPLLSTFLLATVLVWTTAASTKTWRCGA